MPLIIKKKTYLQIHHIGIIGVTNIITKDVTSKYTVSIATHHITVNI